MSNTNAVAPYINASPQDLLNTIGITQFSGETNWFQTIGGLVIQGRLIEDLPLDDSIVVPFTGPFSKQVLGIFVQAIYDTPGAGNENTGLVKTGYTLSQFELLNDGQIKSFFWWAIGV